MTKSETLTQWIYRMGALALGAGVLVLGVHEAQRDRLLGPSEQAPVFRWETHQGPAVSLAQLQGKVVLLNFWTTWCPPCIREMPMLVSETEKHAASGLVFVAASADEDSTRQEAVKRFLLRKLPALSSYVAYPDGASLQSYRVNSYPTTYLIGRDGRVLKAQRGELSAAQLQSWLETALY